MRRVVENLGLSWPAQRVKLAESGERFVCSDIATVGLLQPKNQPGAAKPTAPGA